MFYNCTSLKLSKTRTGEYTQEYRIPSSGDGTNATFDLLRMFDLTGGTFIGTPAINTTYYLSSDNMIARGNEIATLNGYVKTMIDTDVDIPTTLPNPNPLTFTGAVTGSYDGSEPLTVEIPSSPVISGNDIETVESQLVDIPSKLSQFTNDAGYLTLDTLPKYDGSVT